MSVEPKEIFEAFQKHVVSIQFLDAAREVVASGTGILIGKYLVTNNHVFAGTGMTVVVSQSSHLAAPVSHDMMVLRFERKLVTGSDENNLDYAILDLGETFTPFGMDVSILGSRSDAYVGKPIAVLGYPFGKPFLSMHIGHVSAVYKSGPATAIQVDASVNVSNSGGPLVDIETGKIIGLVTRKETGLTASFQQLRKTIQRNIQLVNQTNSGGSRVEILGLDLLQAIDASQRQMLVTMSQIERSSNVGIGIAFAIDPIKEELSNLNQP